ncbi:MAG: delta-60 repeat domain-containing protein, partial [Solirubrobacteraceae bacterium]
MLRLLITVAVAALALPAGAAARPGDLDTGFPGGALLLGQRGAQYAGAALALQGDGRVTVAGRDGRGFLVVRRRASGGPDRSFSGNGRLTIGFTGATRAGARDVALLRDGRILVAGTVTLGGVTRFAVARLEPGGNLDPNFGTDGVAVVGPPGAQLETMALQPEGELVLAGSVPAGARRSVLVMRLLADGTPDPGFGAGGAVDSTAVKLAGRARDVLVLPDGRIALAAAVERGRR